MSKKWYGRVFLAVCLGVIITIVSLAHKQTYRFCVDGGSPSAGVPSGEIQLERRGFPLPYYNQQLPDGLAGCELSIIRSEFAIEAFVADASIWSLAAGAGIWLWHKLREKKQ